MRDNAPTGLWLENFLEIFERNYGLDHFPQAVNPHCPKFAVYRSDTNSLIEAGALSLPNLSYMYSLGHVAFRSNVRPLSTGAHSNG
jgi:hypothetical protein